MRRPVCGYVAGDEPRQHPTMEDPVPRQNYRKILSVLLPAGALGMSILLGSTGAQAAREIPLDPQADAASPRIAERLAAIRDAVSDVTVPGSQAAPADKGSERLAWHNWANFGIGLPLWNNWRNGWNNWGNNWRNGWNNWGNGWNNW
jgi:rSAM-associated Gly-rich repeat protein